MSAPELVQTLEALLAEGRFDDAASIASTALAADPGDAHLSRLLAAAQLGAAGHIDARQVAKASAAQEAARLERQKRDGLEELASQLLERGRLADAEAAADELIRTSPDWAESYNARGRVLIKRKKFDRAESDFRTASSLAPDEAAYMNNVGLALHRRGKRKEAIEWFEKAAVRNPSFAPARTNFYASTRRYLWGGAVALVITIALHTAYLGLRGGPNDRTALFVGLGIIGVLVPIFLARYWLLKRTLDRTAQNLYEAEARRAWRRPKARTLVMAGGLLLLAAAIVAALATNRPPLAVLSVAVAVLMLHRAWTVIRRFAHRFDR